MSDDILASTAYAVQFHQCGTPCIETVVSQNILAPLNNPHFFRPLITFNPSLQPHSSLSMRLTHPTLLVSVQRRHYCKEQFQDKLACLTIDVGRSNAGRVVPSAVPSDVLSE